jgi:hypothetical protein
MLNQFFFSAYYIVVYIWFLAGIIAIGIPAILELFRMLTKRR